MMRLRQAIELAFGRPLSVLILARFSPEEQRQSSIDDQIASCQRFLEESLPRDTNLSRVSIDVIKEPEMSGEVADRPGINQVWAGIEAKRWDLILAEESSRLYRHHTKAGERFESAVDAGIRIICPSDYIDTADDDWPDRLHMCQLQHSRSNFYKRKRIANGERAIEVAEWLDSITFKKEKWARQPKWTAGNVNAIIRRTMYRFETFRVKKSKRKLRTGKSEYVWNDPDKVETRESEHLRIADVLARQDGRRLPVLGGSEGRLPVSRLLNAGADRAEGPRGRGERGALTHRGP